MPRPVFAAPGTLPTVVPASLHGRGSVGCDARERRDARLTRLVEG